MIEDHVYKQTEVTGTSRVSVDEAVRNAIAKTAESVRNLRWFTVEDIRGAIDDEAIAHWQVTVKIGFTVE